VEYANHSRNENTPDESHAKAHSIAGRLRVARFVLRQLASKNEESVEAFIMRTLILSLVATSSLVFGCGATFPPPTQRLADAESAERSATELGAVNTPDAQLHLRLAQEQTAQAKTAMASGDNARADSLLVRATSDAELAIALSRKQSAGVDVQKAKEQSNTQRATNASQGAAQ
jgi:Domain of unknown function (DUF4398)